MQVQAGMKIIRYAVISGKELRIAGPLPATTATRALVAGDSTVYFSSDYECDELMVLHVNASEVRVLRPIGCNGIGPINKDPSILNGNRLLVADSWGFLHSVNTSCWEGISYHVDTSPLGPPTMQSNDTILVGSYDGYLHCLKWKTDAFVAEWAVRIGSTIYCKPLAVTHSICIVCTTAGHVVHVVDGKVMETKHIAGEIWSDPMLLELNENNFQIAFGARDSNVHIVTFSRR
jgi:outer membrane protein assembly factor BamB